MPRVPPRPPISSDSPDVQMPPVPAVLSVPPALAASTPPHCVFDSADSADSADGHPTPPILPMLPMPPNLPILTSAATGGGGAAPPGSCACGWAERHVEPAWHLHGQARERQQADSPPPPAPVAGDTAVCTAQRRPKNRQKHENISKCATKPVNVGAGGGHRGRDTAVCGRVTFSTGGGRTLFVRGQHKIY